MQAPQALALPELAHRREHGGVAARELRHPRQLHPHLENYFVGAESSGGQLNRLLLAKVVLEDSNLLMLDEPTNDLDMESCDVLTYLFTMLCGTVIMLAAKNGTQQICVLGAFGPDLFVGHKIGETRKKHVRSLLQKGPFKPRPKSGALQKRRRKDTAKRVAHLVAAYGGPFVGWG